MQEVIELARKLGEMIANHPRTKSLKEMQQVLDKDEQASNLLKAYQKQIEHIHNLESAGKPIEVDDKHALRDIEQKMANNETLKQISIKEVDFVEMMNKVKTEIDSKIQDIVS
ncbi:MAG: YlbF family regulator [Sedimentisphaerales bacterium]|nr:YlbF family regulator [Sedimentisphaerales bacterium]MBN2844038.1 YlbF family regulator [Sedimentisphaerales bacterium]